MFRILCENCGVVLSLNHFCNYCGLLGDHIECVDLPEVKDDESNPE